MKCENANGVGRAPDGLLPTSDEAREMLIMSRSYMVKSFMAANGIDSVFDVRVKAFIERLKHNG